MADPGRWQRIAIWAVSGVLAVLYLMAGGRKLAGAQAAVEGVTNLQVATVTAGTQYDITLTARSPQVDALTRRTLTSSLRSKVTLAK